MDKELKCKDKTPQILQIKKDVRLNMDKDLDIILAGFEREFDRCNGNYKYNRKPVIKKILENYISKSKIREAVEEFNENIPLFITRVEGNTFMDIGHNKAMKKVRKKLSDLKNKLGI